jgi:alkanesulfonate monooxygenase SsuD/methylene tetrahydromethanopterin reductase-like flavin-dependent oxidoreductase (luciferase family)
MQLLLQHGAGVHAANRIYKMTPLHMAAKEGQRGSAEVLVQAGADVSAAAKVCVQLLVTADAFPGESSRSCIAAVAAAAAAAGFDGARVVALIMWHAPGHQPLQLHALIGSTC